MSTTTEEELQALYQYLNQARVVNNVTIACAAFLVYDILINLDKEIPLIWRYYHHADDEFMPWRHRARRTLIQALFIFGRYYAPLFLGLSVSAYFYYLVFGGGGVVYSALVNVILVIRLNALYRIFYGTEGLRKLQVFLVAVTEFSIWAVIVTWMEGKVLEAPPGISLPGCMLTQFPNTTLSIPAWTVAILVATIFLVLTLRMLYSSTKLKLKGLGGLTISNIKAEIRNIQPITQTLVRDRILIASVAVMVTYHSDLSYVTTPITVALYSFCASRLIVNLRESVVRPPLDVPSQGAGPINFASRSMVASHAGMHA
ncbi:hypothetical protein BKA83DRAFT_4217567 [Pisolithus microcarpus]|nr:hypothetical protein BKA83DRAFT_4217567 [Pisolithus microcarpus]